MRRIVILGIALCVGLGLAVAPVDAAVTGAEPRAGKCGVDLYCFPGSSFMPVSAPDNPNAGPMCGQLYCVPATGFMTYPYATSGSTVFSTALPERSVTSQMPVSWRFFPEAGQTITVSKPVVFNAVHLWLEGLTMLTPAGLDAIRTLGGNFSSNGNDGLEYRPESAAVPFTLTVTVYRLPVAVGDSFNLNTVGAQPVASAAQTTQAVIPQRKPMSVTFPTAVSLEAGNYLISYRISDAPEDLLTVYFASFTQGTIEAAKLDGQPILDYPGGAAYIKGARYANGDPKKVNPAPPGPEDWILHQARLTNNALPEFVMWGPGDVLMDLTYPEQVTKKVNAPSRKACLRKPGYRWDASRQRCVRKR